MRELNTHKFPPPLTKALSAIVALVFGAISSSGDCCQTGKTMYDVVSSKKTPPETVEPITKWKEAPLPPCEFWLCRKKSGYRWALKNVKGEIEVEWYPVSVGQNTDEFEFVEYDQKVTLPEVGYPLIFSSAEPTVTVNTEDGKREVPLAAFDYEHEDGYFFVAEPYSCSPTKLLFYPKSGEPGWEIEADNIRRIIVELDGTLWGVSGYPGTMPFADLVQISEGPSGVWSTKKVASLDSFPWVALKLDDERALAATDRSVYVIENGEVETLLADFPSGSLSPQSMVEDAHGVVYLAVNQGVLKITGIDSLFGPEATLLVPDETYLEYSESCSPMLCSPKPGWMERHLGREVYSPYAWTMGIWFLLTIALGGWLLVKKISKRHR